MAEFIYGDRINVFLEDLINSAESQLWLISPYIKLHDRLKAELKAKLSFYDLEIVVVFGKNENDATRSMKKQDLEFFMQFPNIKICYEKNLHAKFYSNEHCSLLTSMNLHQFSQNTNIEAGILMYRKKTLETLANVLISTQNIEESAVDYFNQVIERSEIIYHSQPEYKKENFGFSKKYTGNKILVNKVNELFGATGSFTYNSGSHQSVEPSQSSFKKRYGQPTAFCIRTGKPIHFDRQMPYCDEAYQSWARYKNEEFPEKFCHSTGKLSHGKTSMKNPIMQ